MLLSPENSIFIEKNMLKLDELKRKKWVYQSKSHSSLIFSKPKIFKFGILKEIP